MKNKIISITLSIIGIGLLFSLGAWYSYGTKAEVGCLVKEKERIADGDYSKYLIFCEDKVLENTDSLWYWKWDSSDFYKDIDEDKEYNFTVYGWRVPFFSKYQNIIEIN